MKSLLEKMINKKKGGAENMSPEEIQAKMDVIQELLDLAGNSQGKSIAGKLQKVSVMAPSKEGLLEGMEKAEEIVEDANDSSEMEEELDDQSSPELASEPPKKEEESEENPNVEDSDEDDEEGLSFMEKKKRKMESRLK